MRHLLILGLIGLSTTGCTELEPFLPTVSFDRMAVQEINFDKADLNFVFAIDNPNPVGIELSSFSYGLGLGGIELLSGDRPDGFDLEPAQSTELSLPVSLDLFDAWQSVQAVRGADTIPFGLDGAFGFLTPLGEVTLPFATSGDFPALRRPNFRYKRIRLDNISLLNRQADFKLDLLVDNEHESMLWFDNFAFDLSMNGESVSTGLLQSLGEVEGGQEGVLTVPFSIDLRRVSASLLSAVTQRQRLNLKLAADVDITIPFLDDAIIPLHIDQLGDLLPE